MHYFNNNINNYIEELETTTKQQNQLLQKLTQSIQKEEKQSLSLIGTVGKLIEYGLNKKEIMDITNLSSEGFENLVTENRRFQLPYIHLNEEETIAFQQFLREIHEAEDIHDLINGEKEHYRIKFIQSILYRYQQEATNVLPESDDNIDMMVSYVEKESKMQKAREACYSILRIFGNEIKMKREEVLMHDSKIIR
ncbi:hypothetical protein [Ornithinibacillus californiensis]|uniref:hypothetical protein n=1 Tax=Ornithinibacillus californiensis TaxID=161536 RepID=UPI00064E056E|nr:hypothetical protein [Ornithinibacillus californiensis]